MKHLIAVELRRLVTRRLLAGLTIVVLAVFALVGVLAFRASSDSPEAMASARAAYAGDLAYCVSEVEAGTLNDEAVPPAATADPAGYCRENVVEFGDPRFDYAEFDWMLLGTGMPFVALAWLVGASAMGAEWNNRTIVTTLTWEPRRARVIATKAIAVAIVAGAWIFLLEMLFALSFYPAAEFEGLTRGIDAGWWLDLAGLGLKISGLAALGAVLGFALATIGRNTAAALGVGFVYLAVVESLVRTHKPSWADWLIGDNASLALMGPDEVAHLGHSQLGAAFVLLAYAGAVVALAILIFRRRDLS
jgi:hypothetical protein